MSRNLTMRFVVRGRVQGVGFRWFVRRRARDLDCAGWVRNLPDESVEVVAGGEDQTLDSLRAFLAQGPPQALVEQVTGEILADGLTLPRPFTIK